MQSDGNLVWYRSNAATQGGWDVMWAYSYEPHRPTPIPGSWLVMQSDGNLVLYSPAGVALWHTNTWSTGPNRWVRLLISDDPLPGSTTPGGHLRLETEGNANFYWWMTPPTIALPPVVVQDQKPPWPLLNDGIPGKIHDPGYSQCLTANGVSVTIQAMSQLCLEWSPMLVASPAPGFRLIAPAGCLTKSATTLTIAECDVDSTSQVFADRLVPGFADRWTLENGVGSAKLCLARPISFVGCNPADPAQQWADAEDAYAKATGVYAHLVIQYHLIRTLGYWPEAKFFTASGGGYVPDLLNIATREFWEIKPNNFTGIDEGKQQLKEKRTAFATLDSWALYKWLPKTGWHIAGTGIDQTRRTILPPGRAIGLLGSYVDYQLAADGFEDLTDPVSTGLILYTLKWGPDLGSPNLTKINDLITQMTAVLSATIIANVDLWSGGPGWKAGLRPVAVALGVGVTLASVAYKVAQCGLTRGRICPI
jgi:hypothetical protein